MFRNRKNTQKPNDDFIKKFQKTFPDVMPVHSQRNASVKQEPAELVDRTRPSMSSDDMKPNDQLPTATPSLQLSSPFVDPNSLSFPLANQPNNLLTPSSGGFNGGFHSQQAGDLHTPTMGLGMMNSHPFPQQFPMESDATTMGLNPLGQQYFSQPFQNAQPFVQQQQSFAPSAFVHRDSGYDAMDESLENSSLHDLDLQVDPATKLPSTIELPEQANDSYYSHANQKFRYNVSLRAPTAMIKNSRDIPISYLNKGQAYSLSVRDSKPLPMGSKVAQYRTHIRISFQEKEQRAKPGSCWQLWKEGRGSSEAHQRGGKLQAVEYVDPFQGGDEDRKGRQIRVESTSFDGFCITWTANPTTGASDCTIPVRFNFLSTDFSHSKGVKGIPVRLCAKTELVSSDTEDTGMERDAEVCYCQVKLFRDHGAERKLSNDVAHVKKTIEKLRQQIMQAEMGGGSSGKRKRANASVAFNSPDYRPSKVMKHKRTWSVDSQEGSEKMTLEDDLRGKLAAMQEMFTSTRPASHLNLQGDEEDDPDLFPVQIPSDVPDSSRKSGLQTIRRTQSNADDVMLSPANSNLSANQTPANMQSDSGYQGSMDSSRSNSFPTSEVSLSHPVKVQRVSSDPNVSAGCIEAVDIDPTYRAPSEQAPKPIACFYLRFPSGDAQKDDFYRAIYLSERSVRDLLEKISLKQRIDPQRIVRVLHIKRDGLKIMVDDDVVRELPDGQDMDVEVSEAANGSDDSKESDVELKLSY